jgi:hypothetical protein
LKKSAKVLLYFGLDCGMMEYSKPKIKNQKPIAVDVFFKALPMIPL